MNPRATTALKVLVICKIVLLPLFYQVHSTYIHIYWKSQLSSSPMVECWLCVCHPCLERIVESAAAPSHHRKPHFFFTKKLRSRSDQVIKRSKKLSWRTYVSSSNRTFSMVLWHKIRKIKGMWFPCTIPGLTLNGFIETAPGAIVNKLLLVINQCSALNSIVRSSSPSKCRRKKDPWFLYISHRG